MRSQQNQRLLYYTCTDGCTGTEYHLGVCLGHSSAHQAYQLDGPFSKQRSVYLLYGFQKDQNMRFF